DRSRRPGSRSSRPTARRTTPFLEAPARRLIRGPLQLRTGSARRHHYLPIGTCPLPALLLAALPHGGPAGEVAGQPADGVHVNAEAPGGLAVASVRLGDGLEDELLLGLLDDGVIVQARGLWPRLRLDHGLR